MNDWQRWQGLIGIAVLLALGYLLSDNRRRIRWSIIVWGTVLQLVFAVVILRTELGKRSFEVLNDAVGGLIAYSNDGAAFLFKPLNDRFETQFVVVSAEPPVAAGAVPPPAADRPVDATNATTGLPPAGARLVLRNANGPHIAPPLVNMAFVVLPTVIFFSALLAVLYHIGLMQWVVKAIAWVMIRTMGTSGAETLSVAANIFVGQTEAPLLVRPFLATMTRSELMTVMVGGFATIAGGVLALYVSFLQHIIPDIAGHLMAASVMSAPATIVFAKLVCPETAVPTTLGTVHVQVPRTAANVLEAFGDGVTQGMQLALNIAAMLLAFVAAVALVNGVLGLIPVAAGQEPWSLQTLLGQIFRPIAWTLGVDWSEARTLGMLLGEKLVLTELIAYGHMGTLRTGVDFSERTAIIASYALCGFANFASIGIQLGGIGAMAPECKPQIAALAFRAMVAGTLATCMTAAIAGLLL